MAVFVWATGAIVGAVTATTGTVSFTVNNRTTASQNGVAVLFSQPTNNTAKTAVGTVNIALAANSSSLFTITNTSAVNLTAYEVEVRLPDPHMDVYAAGKSGLPGVATQYAPGSFFRDSSSTGNP